MGISICFILVVGKSPVADGGNRRAVNLIGNDHLVGGGGVVGDAERAVGKIGGFKPVGIIGIVAALPVKAPAGFADSHFDVVVICFHKIDISIICG